MAAAVPAVLGKVATVATVVGTGMSVYSAIKGGNAQVQSANYDANQAAQSAITVRRQSEVEAGRIRRQGDRALGEIRAAYAASGVDASGTPTEVLADSAAQVELDALTARYNGELQALGYERTAALDYQRAKDAATATKIGAVSALINGVATVGSLVRK